MGTDVDFDTLWQRVDPNLRTRAIGILRENLTPELAAQIRAHISIHGKHAWIHKDPFDHMLFGMQVRNALRQGGISDDQLPAFDEYYGKGTDVRNWDDYYVQALEEAVQ